MVLKKRRYKRFDGIVLYTVAVNLESLLITHFTSTVYLTIFKLIKLRDPSRELESASTWRNRDSVIRMYVDIMLRSLFLNNTQSRNSPVKTTIRYQGER